MNFELNDFIRRVAAVLPEFAPVYLVGGAVRDLLLGRQIHDLDFVLSGDVFKIARQAADRLDGAFFPLDPERLTARVILHQPDGARDTLDFTAMRGPDLESDLRSRDFTINAIAIDVRHPGALVDPLSGANDLFQRILRPCSTNSLMDDPVRVLRAIRLAAAFDLRISPETLLQIHQAAPRLPQTSPERIRDEFFRLLDIPKSASAVRVLSQTGILKIAFPELAAMHGVEQSEPHVSDVWTHALEVVSQLNTLLALLFSQNIQEDASNLILGLAVLQLGRFREQLEQHLETRLNVDRPYRPLLMMAALYHDVGKPDSQQVEEGGKIHFYRHEQVGEKIVIDRAQALHLSNAEIDRLGLIVRHHMRPGLLAGTGQQPTRRAIYRFFRDTGPAGVDICLLSLADVRATYGTTLPIDVWNRQLEIVRILLEAWWERPQEELHPIPILNGDEIMTEFHLASSPLIGELLAALREAQASGELSTHPEALAFIKNYLSQR